MQILIFLVFLVIVLIAGYLGYLQQQKRRQELSELATELGWRFDPSHDSSHEERYPQFGIFTRGHSRYAYHSLRGEFVIAGESWPVVMGDYHYRKTSGTGKNRRTRTYRFSFLILDLPHLHSCDLAVRQEGVFDKLAGMIGFDDIDFESAEFSDRFHVKSSDKKFAYDVLHPRMMEFLLDNSCPDIDIARRACCLYTNNRCWSPDQFKTYLHWADNFFGLWPRYLTQSLEMDSQQVKK